MLWKIIVNLDSIGLVAILISIVLHCSRSQNILILSKISPPFDLIKISNNDLAYKSVMIKMDYKQLLDLFLFSKLNPCGLIIGLILMIEFVAHDTNRLG